MLVLVIVLLMVWTAYQSAQYLGKSWSLSVALQKHRLLWYQCFVESVVLFYGALYCVAVWVLAHQGILIPFPSEKTLAISCAAAMVMSCHAYFTSIAILISVDSRQLRMNTGEHVRLHHANQKAALECRSVLPPMILRLPFACKMLVTILGIGYVLTASVAQHYRTAQARIAFAGEAKRMPTA